MTEPPILFRDPRFVVLNKPAGLPAHPGPRGGPSAEDWFPALSRRRDGPWLAHRLDADTAGCLVVALRRAALVEAQALFATGRAGKVYWAIVRGRPAGTAGRIETRLRKHSAPSGWRMLADPDGAEAVTDWRLAGAADGLSWLEVRPRTGRTHQIRVHLAGIGCAILGDPVYGQAGGGLRLLARSIHLPLASELRATAPPPPHMHAELAACGWQP